MKTPFSVVAKGATFVKRDADSEYATQQAGEVQARINHTTLVELKPLME